MQNFLLGLIFDHNSDMWLGLVCDGRDAIGNSWWWDGSHPTYTNFWPGFPTPGMPLALMVVNGLWQSQYDFFPRVTVVVCQKPART